ncbi:MAG TPA: enoyl-CoA hydratase [Gammaproteobacteria bacterium]|nr:enoyl-CoA hydratase [Gammaproteobacteria bacterium]|tara:strand:- start:50 stop:850 length:801 start_codon:yes stop_codon:yes gene_type:complete
MKASSAFQDTSPIVIKETRAPGVMMLTLNRPDQYNPLSEQMLSSLQAEIDEVSANNEIKVLIIAATGKAFCAGHDLKEMRATPDQLYYEDLFSRCSQMMLTLARMPQIVVARVQGMATAAGCQLVANADLAVTVDTARFAVSGINLGLFCSTPSVPLSRAISRKRAFEMLTTGGFIDAHTAHEYGLVNDVVPADKLDETVDALAQNIASKPADALRTGKALFYRQLNMPLAEAYQAAGQVMADNMLFRDTQEGVDAFIEKRDPNWN